MSYHHKSGARKRKEKEERDKSASKGQYTLDSIINFTLAKRDKISTETGCTNISGFQEETTVCSTSSATDVCSTSSATDVCSTISRTDVSLTSSSTDAVQENGGPQQAFSSALLVATDNSESEKRLHGFDVAILEELSPTVRQIEEAVLLGASPYPKSFPDDDNGHPFPCNILEKRMKNGQLIPRDWLVWSRKKSTLFCFPCRLFCKLPAANRSSLACPTGYKTGGNWKKLYNRIPEHESCASHKSCYVEWRNLELRLLHKSSVDMVISETLRTETKNWRDILVRILDTILFLGERGLALRGGSHRVGDPNNGNFLGILELLSHYDPLLREHLTKVKLSQTNHRKMQVNYLSPDSQNEFLQCCAEQVKQVILKEREEAKYFAIIVDSTPDAAHKEQTVFVIRYIRLSAEHDSKPFYKVEERFLDFKDCSSKTGEAIAELIRSTLINHKIPINDCRGQGYDNGANMKGQYKGVQSRLLQDNPLALFCPCACHSLNLAGTEAAESSPEVMTFFGVLHKCYNIFSSSPQRWEILQTAIGCSLHKLCHTRWSARVDCVKPFAAHLPGMMQAIKEVQGLNLTAETRMDVNGIEQYLNSFECVLMSSIWFKVLTEINYVNTILQERGATIDVEIRNIYQLIANLTELRNNWEKIIAEVKLVSANINIEPSFPKKRAKRKILANKSIEVVNGNPEDNFKQDVYYMLLDTVLANLSVRYTALKDIDEKFNFLWKYPTMAKETVIEKAKKFFEIYQVDISENIVDEMDHLRAIQTANFPPDLTPLQLLDKITQQKLGNVFPNVCIALRIFCTLPVTVAHGERSFSVLGRVKNLLRSTMTQDRLSYLGTLALESQLARQLDFQDVINSFASKKARRALL